MRHSIIGCFATLALIACSSGSPNPDPGKNPNPNPNPMPMEPAPKPVWEAPEYPTGNYGFMQGMTIRKDLKFKAYLAGAKTGDVGELNFNDLYDPDGSRGINAILVVTSAEWCGACMTEAQQLPGKIQSSWGKDGVIVIEMMIEDTTKRRDDMSVTSAADRWRTKFALNDMPVGIDGAFTFAQGSSGTIGLPLNHLIDPRTMTVVFRGSGWGTSGQNAIASLVSKNKL